MFSKSKKDSRQEAEQREQYEYARKRIQQKKGLLSHFIYFVAGSIILLIINLVLGIGKGFTFLQYDWHVWVTLLWAFLLLTNLFNVFVKNRFMGKEWEHRQLEKLKNLQEEKIAKLEKKVEKEISDLPDASETNIEESN